MKYWLMKSEPDEYGILDLQREGVGLWGGVRNYQARNFMRDEMQVGDKVLFYHSNAHPPGIAGLATIASSAFADPTAFDPDDPYYDPASRPDAPRWLAVKVAFVCVSPVFLSLSALRANPLLSELLLLRKGQRLSIQPVSASHYAEICSMAEW